MLQIKVLFFIFIFILSYFQSTYSQENNYYPTPERLFHVERSKNMNLVCYDVKLAENNKLDSSKPIAIYWVNREEEPGKTNGLSAIQKKLAYGYKLHKHDGDSCIISLNACSDKRMVVKKDGDSYHCLMTIDNQPAKLDRVYVQAKKGNSLSVEYVELSGTSVESGKSVSEKVIK